MSRGARIRLLVFAVIGGLAVVHAGANYAGLTDKLLPTTYTVEVRLAESGGLFERGEVTYRGFTVGRVDDLAFDTHGVTAVLAIEDDWRIPADLTAEVHNRSAVGEQYLDLVPRTESGPYLHEGSVIATADTSTPTPEEELIVAADRLFRSIDADDLTTVVDESAAAFGGAGDDLGRLLDNTGTLLDAARDSLPETIALLNSGGTVLATQDAQAQTIASYLDDLATVSGVLARGDRQLRLVLPDGTEAARQLRLLAAGLSPDLPVLLAHAIDLSGILAERRDGLEETLVAIPWALASAQTPGRDGRAHFTFVGGVSPTPCRDGYIPAQQWQSPMVLTPSVVPDDIGCRTPSSVPRGVTAH